MGIMAIGRIIVLSALFAQTLSAPSGCIESCDFHHTSYQSRRTSGGYQDHAGLVQGSTNLNDLDYAKPGNWTEHNQYNTDAGHGKVYEERGQYVEGSKRVRYYKKNFTASYGDNVNRGTELGGLSGQHRYDSLNVPSNQHFDSQSTHDQSGYDRVHSQQTQSSSMRLDSKSERLEDFGEYSGHSQVNQHVPSINTQTIDTQQHVETTPRNWNRVDSYQTDAGHGRVFEEEGQYVTGPKKVRYYKKNYTSSYSTSGVPQSNIGSATLNELHSELQRNLHKELDNLRTDFHQASSTGHTASTTHIDSAMGLTQEAVRFHGNDLQTAETENYGQQLGYRRLPSTGTTGTTAHHYTDQQHRETFTDTRQQTPYTYPTGSADTYGTENQRTYQSHETYTSRGHPTPHAGSPGLARIPLIRTDYQPTLHNVYSSEHQGVTHGVHKTQRAGVLDTHQSSVAQSQLLPGGSQHAYNPNPGYGTYPSTHGETRRYEGQWSSSSHDGGSSAPERTPDHNAGYTERAHYDRVAYNEQRGRHHAAQGYNPYGHTGESSYNPAYRPNSGQLVTGSLDLGHMAHGADCTEETHQYQQESRYHRKYKRDDHHGDVQQHQTIDNENLTQQTEDQLEFGQQTVDNQHLEDLTQQSEQLTQQTQGSDDLTQQTSGKLEFGQQTIDSQHLEDLTQQTEGQLEFGQQTVGNQHLEDLTQQSEQLTQQTQGSDDLTQQTSGKLEFGQQTIDSQHLEDLTQQTEGQLEFGQQTVGNQHLEDLTQQSEQLTQQTQGSDDLTQQTSGKLEFGQQTIDSQHLEDLTQQTEGQLEFGQQTVGNQHLEDLTQQSEQLTQQTQGSDDLTQQMSGKLEFGQQTIDSQHLEDLTQQTEGQFEFGQQTVGNQHLEDLMQQTQDDFTQQAVGKLEFGQQMDDAQQFGQLTQQTEKLAQRTTRSDELTQQTVSQFEFGQRPVGNQHLEDLTQQSEQLTQQTENQFGQYTVGNQHLEDLTQQSEQFAQQTNSDDFTQQTMGQVEFGQQQSHGSDKLRVDNQHLEDFTQQDKDLIQQIGGFNIFAQQAAGSSEYGQQREQQQKPRPRYTQHSEYFSQQNSWNDLPHQYPTYNNNNNNKQSELEQMSQKTDFNQDFIQQTDHAQELTTGVPKPAPKPKLRQRHDSTPLHIDGTDTNLDDTFNPVKVDSEADIDNFQERNIQRSSRITDSESNYRTSNNLHTENQRSSVFDNEKENMDRLHWLHKSNDATVGLQWHYTYHPSDLTNIEDSHNNYYPHNVNSMSQQTEDAQQQSKPFDFNQQETQNMRTFEDMHQNSYTSQSSQAQRNEYDQQLGSFQQTQVPHFDSQFDQNSEQNPSKVIPLQHNQNSQQISELDKQSPQTTEQTDKIESRILEAYGGGPYDASRDDDIYRRVKPNPGAILPPIYSEDPWDIREKPRDLMIPPTIINTSARNTPIVRTTITTESTTTTEAAETTTQIIETTTTPSSFWGRLGHKITNTYDKAKEKAKEIFG